jgi:hypothetical protein
MTPGLSARADPTSAPGQSAGPTVILKGTDSPIGGFL